MPKDITKGVARTSIHSGDSDMGSSKEKEQKRPKRWYRNEQWIYGFHLKNRHFRRISQIHGLPWKKEPLRTMQRVIDHIAFVSKSRFRLRSIQHGYEKGLVMFFVEADGRKRMRDAIASVEDMDRVRKALGLPKGTKPKWYNCHGCDEHNNAADSSEDEAMPVSRAIVPPPPKVDVIVNGGEFQESDSSMSCDNDNDDSDESTSSDSDEEGGVGE